MFGPVPELDWWKTPSSWQTLRVATRAASSSCWLAACLPKAKGWFTNYQENVLVSIQNYKKGLTWWIVAHGSILAVLHVFVHVIVIQESPTDSLGNNWLLLSLFRQLLRQVTVKILKKGQIRLPKDTKGLVNDVIFSCLLSLSVFIMKSEKNVHFLLPMTIKFDTILLEKVLAI